MVAMEHGLASAVKPKLGAHCLPLPQVGGDSMEAQFAELAGNPDVIVATPGRLAHHLAEVAGFGLKTVEYIVFDEADRRARLAVAH